MGIYLHISISTGTPRAQSDEGFCYSLAGGMFQISSSSIRFQGICFLLQWLIGLLPHTWLLHCLAPEGNWGPTLRGSLLTYLPKYSCNTLIFLNTFLASFLTTNTLCDYSPQTHSLLSFLPLSFMAQSSSTRWMMGHWLTGESLNLPEQVGWEADSWQGVRSMVCLHELWEGMQLIPQIPLLGPTQASISKWVYFRSVSMLELYILDSLLRVWVGPENGHQHSWQWWYMTLIYLQDHSLYASDCPLSERKWEI